MKKIMMLLAVAALMLGLSGQAMALAVYGDLIQVIYQTNNSTGTEYVTDLGNLNTLISQATPSGYTLGNSNLFSLGTLNGYQVAYFATNNSAGSNIWVSGDGIQISQTAGQGQQGTFASPYNTLMSQAMTSKSGFNTMTLASTSPNSYMNLMNQGSNSTVNGTNGGFDGFLNNYNGESTIAGSAVTQYLYAYTLPNSSENGVDVLKIVTNADGSTELIYQTAPSATPPVLSAQFGLPSIPLNGSTSLRFTVQNNNATSGLTGVGFNDTLPAGLVVSTPNGLTGSCSGGTITANAGANGISLSGASLAQSSSCTFSVNVKGIAVGVQTNTTGNVTSNEGGNGNAATAPLTVTAVISQPAVSSTTPLNNAVGVAPNGAITITWNENIDCTTVNTTTITINNSAALSSPTCSGQTATFPVSGQSNNSTYTVAVGTGVKDISGNNMAAAYSFSYTTYDTIPDVFTLSAQTGVAVSTVIESNPITVTGINYQTPISISGGDYQINGGAWTNTSGTVNSGDTVKVRVTSSSAYSTTTTATLTVGGVIGTFSVTTTPITGYVLTVNASGNGAGTVSSTTGGISYSYPTASTGSATLSSGTAVTLTATAGRGTGVSWSGNCDSTGGTTSAATCTITNMNAAKNVAATFSFTAVWTHIPGAIISPPALAWNPVSSKIEMVVRGSGNSIWAATFNSDGTFNSDWTNVPGAIISPPAIAWNPSASKMQMLVQGSGNSIWAATFGSDGTFNSDWTQIPGAILNPPAVAWNPSASKMQMLVQGSGNSIWSATFKSDGTFNSDWTQIPGAIQSTCYRLEHCKQRYTDGSGG